MSIETELLPVVRSTDALVDVVFVHGLNGDPIGTWRMDDTNSWPTWIRHELPRADAWSLQYRLRAFQWQGGAMPLLTRAVNVLAMLDVELSTDRPIVFICHSYGGLLVKQMLRSADDIAPEYRRLTKRVAGIVFFGTPNSGSSIATFVDSLAALLNTGPAVEELRRSSPALQNLSYWFRNNAEKWKLRVYFETLPTHGAIVVDESSADLGIAGIIPVGIDATHFTICKPTTMDLRVKQTLSLIKKISDDLVASIETSPAQLSWMAKVISSPNHQLYFIRAELEAQLAKAPADVEARKALAYLQRIEDRPGGVVASAPAPKFDRSPVMVYVLAGFLMLFLAASLFIWANNKRSIEPPSGPTPIPSPMPLPGPSARPPG